MSYILDALKKSDQERKQGDVPNLQTVHVAVAPEQNNPWLMYAVILLLLMALAFVIGVMISGKGVPESLSNDPQESLQDSNVKDAVSLNAPMSEEMGAGSIESEKALIKPVRQAERNALPLHQKAPAILAGTHNRQTIKVPDISEIPFLYELDDYQQQLVPEMSFAGHVYSSVAASRSVIINGRAISEGEMLMPGMSVEQITSQGVVFRFNNIVFRVDVLQDWSFE